MPRNVNFDDSAEGKKKSQSFELDMDKRAIQFMVPETQSLVQDSTLSEQALNFLRVKGHMFALIDAAANKTKAQGYRCDYDYCG